MVQGTSCSTTSALQKYTVGSVARQSSTVGILHPNRGRSARFLFRFGAWGPQLHMTRAPGSQPLLGPDSTRVLGCTRDPPARGREGEGGQIADEGRGSSLCLSRKPSIWGIIGAFQEGGARSTLPCWTGCEAAVRHR